METFLKIYPFIISFFLLLIAFEQLRTNKDKVKLELYNKRFKVYSDTLRFFQTLVTPEKDRSENDKIHREFIKSLNESKFLFPSNSGVTDILQEMNRKSGDIIGYHNFKDVAKITPGVPDGGEDMVVAMRWFDKEIPELEKKLLKFLKCRNYSI